MIDTQSAIRFSLLSLFELGNDTAFANTKKRTLI